MSSQAEIEIHALNLQLPSGFERRAEAIAREMARELSRMPLAHSLELSSMTVPPVNFTGGDTDKVIARRIAGAIHRQIRSMARQGAEHD